MIAKLLYWHRRYLARHRLHMAEIRAQQERDALSDYRMRLTVALIELERAKQAAMNSNNHCA